MRLGIVVMLSGFLLVGTAIPAAAHAELIASNPADGSSLVAAPPQVQLTFNQAVSLGDNPVQITGPGTWTVGEASVAGAVVTAPVTANGPAGLYTLSYRVVSGDGDPVTGSVKFTMTGPAVPTTTTTTTTTATVAAPPPTSAETAPQEDDGGLPVWVWIAGAAVVVAALVAVALRVRRR